MSWGDENCKYRNVCGYDFCPGQYGCTDFERDNHGDANSVIQESGLSCATNQALLGSSALQQEIDKYKAVLRQAKGTLTVISGIVHSGRPCHLGDSSAYSTMIGTATMDAVVEVIQDIEKLGV
jgi:hypothetical protein